MDFNRKTVTSEQLEAVLAFMKENPQLARAQCRRNAGKYWALLAKKVNSKGGGPAKSAIQWSKVWADMKYRTRRKAWTLKGLQDDSPEMPLEDAALLTPMEEDILKLVGEKEFEDVIIKRDPLSESIPFDEPEDDASDNENDPEEGFSLPPDPAIESLKKERSVTPQRAEATPAPSRSQKPKRPLEMKREGPPRKRPVRNSDDANGDIRRSSEEADEVAAFLRVEEQKLESADKLTEAVTGVKEELVKVVDVLTQIKDMIVNTFTS